MRCSNEIGVAGRLGSGLVAVGTRAPIGLDLPAALGGFGLLAVDRRSALIAVFFVAFFRLVPVFLRAALPPVRFLRMSLALLLTFFLVVLVAIAASVTLFLQSLPNDRISQQHSRGCLRTLRFPSILKAPTISVSFLEHLKNAGARAISCEESHPRDTFFCVTSNFCRTIPIVDGQPADQQSPGLGPDIASGEYRT